jgi:hypothetical protein
MSAAQSRQKSYADVRRRDLEFSLGDNVLLKVSPTKGIVRFGIQGKLSHRYIGPYLITSWVGSLVYRLQLPEYMARVHPVFHVKEIYMGPRTEDWSSSNYYSVRLDYWRTTSACIGVLGVCNVQLYYQVRKDLMEQSNGTRSYMWIRVNNAQ